MVVMDNARILIDGEAKGKVLKLAAPICFWGGVDPLTGEISDPKHPACGMVVTDRILAIPKIVGSSSSSQLLLELFYQKTGPAAILLGEADSIIGVAALVGREMAFGTIPILQMKLDGLADGMELRIERGGVLHHLDSQRAR